MPEAFDWLKPAPLWGESADEMLRTDFFRPRLFEFASDDFVQEFQAAACAVPPTALRRAVLATSAAAPAKLFQPLHGRFYLAGASLACRLPGFPDRLVARADGERVFFVLRKLAGGAEYGWVAGGPAKGWRLTEGSADRILPGEEPLPAFPVAGTDGRTVYTAYVPVVSRDTYAAPSAESPLAETDPRPAQLEGVLAALRALLHQREFDDPPGGDARGDRQGSSSVILLELALFLEREAPLVYAALPLPDDPPPPSLADARAQGLVTYLRGKEQAPPSVPPVRLARAIAEAGARRADIDRLPDAPSPLAYDLRSFNLAPDVPTDPAAASAFRSAIESGLPAWDPGAQPPRVEVGKFARQQGDLHTVRPVYRRPQCEPPQDWVGRAAAPFELAPVFDPDAPARPIRIALPEDVSVAGLRKFAKGVAFSVSRQLQEQLDRVSPGMLKGDAPAPPRIDLGFICTLSIPIITICAFILLILIVNLLNIVFRWLPFFSICLPMKFTARS